ncbi:MAG: hypothetical protein CMJ48_05665 [Planctomycetaceae bacterium]|nr:hypothetical protein [Planctomycetaceae bacterium]
MKLLASLAFVIAAVAVLSNVGAQLQPRVFAPPKRVVASPKAVLAVPKQRAAANSRAVEIEVLIVEITGAPNDKRLVGLSDSAEKVAARVRELESKGEVDVLDRIRLTTLEDQRAMVQVGRSVAVASGRMVSSRGGSPRTSYQQQQIGTLISATARVDGKTVVAELQVEKSQLERLPAKADSKPDDEFVPRATETMTSQTTVRIADGTTVLAGGMQTHSKTASTQKLVLVSARILDAGPTKITSRPNPEPGQIKVFVLTNVDAGEAAKVVSHLFEGRPGAPKVVKVEANARTNSLIVSGHEEQLELIEALLLKLDSSEKKNATSGKKK